MTTTVKPSKTIVLLGRRRLGKSSLVHRVVRDQAGVNLALKEIRSADTPLWIADNDRLGEELVGEAAKRRTPQQRDLGDLLFLDRPRAETVLAAGNFLSKVAWTDSRKHWLPLPELLQVRALPDARRYIIGGLVDRHSRTLTVYRGDLSTVTVSLSVFRPTGTGVAPDPRAFEVIDGGQAVRLGKYEATADLIFYEGDPAYRRALNQRRKQEERGFGPALRRLRLQRRLRQSDFGEIPAKTIARIERGEIGKPQQRTLDLIARKLGVAPEEIASF